MPLIADTRNAGLTAHKNIGQSPQDKEETHKSVQNELPPGEKGIPGGHIVTTSSKAPPTQKKRNTQHGSEQEKAENH